MSVLLLYILLTLPALGGRALAVRVFGFDDADGWAVGRTLGLVMVAYPAWWAGVGGISAWQWAGVVVLAAVSLWGALELWRNPPDWRSTGLAEAVFLGCAAVAVWIRLVRPEILNQEKLMDLGIFASLLRAEGFPPPDMWLAGETLPYYYWGAVVWIVPLFISKIPLDLAYNLVVAALGGVTGCVLWALGRRAGAGPIGGWIAVAAGLFAGTADGLRQLAAGVPLLGLDYWHSSRQVPDTITEWPLFTLWLGDLHPHLLSMPLALAAVLVAWQVGRDGPKTTTVGGVTVLVGVTWAANPWAMPPTLVAAGLMMLCGDGRWHWPGREGWPRWVSLAVVAVGGWVACFPFHIGFHPPFQGIKAVEAWTEVHDLLLWGGLLLVPATAAGWALLVRLLGGGYRARASAAAVCAAGLAAAAMSGRPSLVVLGVLLLVLMLAGLTGPREETRPSVALAALGVFLLAVPEMVYVVDSYGAKLHRMNTIFKCYVQAWPFLAVALPGLIVVGLKRRRSRWVMAAALGVLGLPHFLGLALQPTTDRAKGLDGLAWMEEGDRAIVRYLRTQPSDTTIAEAVGGAYTEFARISSASGVPSLLGWANHELVWRGHGVSQETTYRKNLIDDIYRSSDPEVVRRAVEEAGVDLVVIGALERREFQFDGLEAVRRAGEVVFTVDGGEVVRFAGDR
ncbi:MAG: DUF2298 domain-containing protein [Thermoanaerobaculales bacterium]|nr:DUF2298 domain-containing protein [Thermoanaerobaculales bacterium]